MKIVIDGTAYRMDSIEKLTLRELILLEIQSEALGRRLTMHAIKTMAAGLDQCGSDAEREAHPDAAMFFGLGVWIARRRSGEDITLGDALDFDLATVQLIREEGDGDPTSTGPTSARPGSGPGGRKRPADRAAKKTSTPRSPQPSS